MNIFVCLCGCRDERLQCCAPDCWGCGAPMSFWRHREDAEGHLRLWGK